MTNLGIVIAVSEYSGDADNLPACKLDGVAMAQLLRASGRFDDVLQIDTETTGASVKERLADFAKNNAGKSVDEVFFYFTGHGDFAGDEFYYLLSDYQQKKLNQTSLENSELDAIIRSLSPKLFVKIVDACHSGVSYIKASTDFKEYLKSASDKKFDKLYFCFSSQTDQFSYQGDKISYFTDSVLRSILHHSSATIRYKDVISFVSDDFKERDFQTPLFITQADFTEIFCDVTGTLKELVTKYIGDEDRPSGAKPPSEGEENSLVARLKAEAKTYCTKEEAFAAVASLEEQFRKAGLPQELREIFSHEVTKEVGLPPSPANVGTWLDKGKDERKYFARPTREMRDYQKRVLKDPHSLNIAFGRITESDYTYVPARREIITGFSFTTEMPFQFIRLRLNPLLPNIPPAECYVVPIISRTHLRIFWSFAHFEYLDWEKTRRLDVNEWSTAEALLTDNESLSNLVDQVEKKFEQFVMEPLKARWGSTQDDGVEQKVGTEEK